ncbi:hypothetical protein M406DRAFT_344720 [Cryphonectria parasitica EP155]|uniref:3-methylcrotonyl-CoA carboxylase alpha subunit n=1 Tax=Cryphonectria parasitica (strain ATCC 38755 / EP155) TaxID=660469 RepID=A0A9P4Y8Z5_CRYP1|nr:uncharacterized protein M406DRAFT_344720 [Cryphonectria parasitica EP155]KAF3768614.1 hypothetical protein M406DRAFT_344720 [Cryphonectria parasitica EP155]
MRSLKRAHQRLPLRSSPASRFLFSTTTSTASSSSSSTTSQIPINPITSVIIANRGEIALRIARTASLLGIRTTTLYTDVDRAAQHTLSSPASLSLPSYLDGDRILDLAKQHGIQALHPGYGFLSENAAFARKCEEAGIVFVGPPASAMADMGDKARSKEIMTAAGVPCVPGYHGSEQSVEALQGHACDIGFPVLLKSVKGGGGKGMRIVRSEDEFAAQLTSARAEARASFGEGGEVMLVEKYVVRPRHVEVQVFADRHGGCVALGERDCSVQRRHQKILEESPAPLLDEPTRQDLWDKARTAALAVGYVGAGTVEFILDRDTGRFYFMEMNTRLQVEHPVSEMVTGTDLVEWQFRVAAGERLPLTQAEIEARIADRGAAIEARIYAENPEKGFIPDSGTLVHLSTPATDEDVRIDAGFAEGDTVSQAYDGMIAKLIVRGPDRETAIRKLELALREYEVVGLSTNIEFLKRLCRSQPFIDGDVETGFIEKHREDLFSPRRVEDETFVQASLGLLAEQLRKEGAASSGPHGETLGFGHGSATTSERNYAFRVVDGYSAHEDEVVRASITQLGHNLFRASISRKDQDAPQIFDTLVCEPTATAPTLLPSSSSSLSFSLAKTAVRTFFPLERIDTTLVRDPTHEHRLSVFQRGGKTELMLLQPSWYEKALGLKEVTASVVAPMPCKILRNEVAEGKTVEKGAPLVVIESMKMETVIRSPQKGVVKKLAHKEGDICKAGTVLVLFEEGESGDDAAS